MKSFYFTAVLALAFAFLTITSAFAGNAASTSTKLAEKSAHATCATECNKCAEACEKALAHLQSKGASEATVNVLKDCITLCKTSADLKSRGSELSAKLASACAEACKKCAKVCADQKDEALKDCIEQCNVCADACTNTAKASGGKDCCK
ncbi:MAG: hypothetical protein K2Y39_02050 [Candidatus Obscuribacterales bacterium]|nr:hypothetical protein [Candidatus Obscuribacterales bacterium]